MLNKQQLEQIKDREEVNYFKTEVGPLEKDAAQTALTLLDMLKRLEWCWDLTFDEENKKNQLCPCCDANKKDGHFAGCELGNLLREVEG